MADNVATQILDDLTEHDVQRAKVDSGLRRRIAARMDELEKDLRRLADEIDPAGTLRKDARIRRLGKLDAASREAIRQAYADLHKITREHSRTMAGVESQVIVDAIGANLP